ncbi:MAG: hypothetical protein JO227_16295 [Acetobacteraceae bacterium]|nr:hypothetical protein [Acetobacteraceae bacterium]
MKPTFLDLQSLGRQTLEARVSVAEPFRYTRAALVAAPPLLAASATPGPPTFGCLINLAAACGRYRIFALCD